MNKEYILKRIKPYLNDQGMLGEEDFNKLFVMFSRHQQYEVIDVLIESNIEIDYYNVSKENLNSPTEFENKKHTEKIDKLTNEQLCLIYQQGNDLALEALVSKNINFVWSRVKKYRNAYKHKLDEDDLLQYGVMGLMKAAKMFESMKEAKFTTYAAWWVDQFILRSIPDYGFTIRIPVHCFEEVNKLMRAFREHPDCSKEKIYEIVKENGISRGKFEEILGIAENIMSVSSLNSFVGEDENSELGEFVVDETNPTVEDIVESKALKEAIKDVLDTVTAREGIVLRLRFGLDDGKARTLEEVGKEFKVTRERIRQIEAKALRKLRHPSRSKKLKDFI